MVRGSSYSRTGGGGASSWHAYEPNNVGYNGEGYDGDGYNNRHRVGQSSRSNDRRGDDQDAVWGAHPNNANLQRPRNNNRQNQQPNRQQQDKQRAANTNQPRGNSYNNDSDRNSDRGCSPVNTFSNNVAKHASGGNNADNRQNSNNAENNYSGSSHSCRQQSNVRNNNSSPNYNNQTPPPSNFNRSPQPQQQQFYNSTSSSCRPSRSNKVQLQVLYTHQKNKKKKSWKDGRFTLSGTSGSLYEACPNPGSSGAAIDTLDFSRDEARALAEGCYGEDCLESEKFLIQVEGPWTATDSSQGVGGSSGNGNDPLWNKRPKPPQSGLKKLQPSRGMKRVLNTKYRVPKRIQPMHPEERRERAWRENGMSKRSRPLQPGELERQYYGGGAGGHQEYHGDEGGYGGQNGGGYHGGQNGGGGGYVNAGGDNNGGWERNDYDQNNQGYRWQDGHPGQRNRGDWGNEDHGDQHPGNQGYPQRDDDERVEKRGHGRPPPPYYQGQDNNDGYPNSNNDGTSREDDGNVRGPNRSQQPPSGSSRSQQGNNYGKPASNSLYRNPNRGGPVANSGGGESKNGPPQFQSNEYDPNGFYGEEEEGSEEEGEHQHGGGSVAGSSGLQFHEDSEMQGRNQQRSNGSNLQQQRAVHFQDQHHPGDDRNNGMSTANCPPLSDGRERQEQEAGAREHNSMTPSPQHATSDELLALFGAAPAPPVLSPAPRKASQSPALSRPTNASDQNVGDNGAGQNNNSNYISHQNNNHDEVDNNSFLASILQAEEQVNNRGVSTDGGHTGDLTFSSDGLGGWGEDGDFEDDDYDDDGNGGDGGKVSHEKTVDDTEMDQGGEAVRNGTNDPPHRGGEADEEGVNVSAFTLPSAGESSSEDDEED